MTGDVVNLRQARKHRARQEKDQKASENRRKFGRSRAERLREQKAENQAKNNVDGHRLVDRATGDE